MTHHTRKCLRTGGLVALGVIASANAGSKAASPAHPLTQWYVQPAAHFYPPLETARDRLLIQGWKFHRGDAPGAEAAGFNDAGWRTVNLPHDWSIAPMPAAELDVSRNLPVIAGQWRFFDGDKDDYARPDFNDSSWPTTVLPEMKTTFKPHSYHWFRRTIVISPEQLKGGVEFFLGRIADCDEFYVNGQKVGESGVMPKNQPQGQCVSAADKPRRYPVPAKWLKPGTNQLALCVYCGQGPGGFTVSLGDQSSGPDKGERVGPFFSGAIGGTASGFTVGGVGWYRQHFQVAAADAGKHFEIVFGGGYMNSEVWLNGHPLGYNPYGYSSFYYDLTPFIQAGADNVLAVRVRNEGVTSRWYPGSGIYRNVWLVKTGPARLRQWVVRVLTPEGTEAQGRVLVQTEVAGNPTNGELRVALLDPGGKVVATDKKMVAGEMTPMALRVKQPQLWDPDACATWRGHELAILHPNGRAGKMTLTVASQDFPTATLEIPVK